VATTRRKDQQRMGACRLCLRGFRLSVSGWQWRGWVAEAEAGRATRRLRQKPGAPTRPQHHRALPPLVSAVCPCLCPLRPFRRSVCLQAAAERSTEAAAADRPKSARLLGGRGKAPDGSVGARRATERRENWTKCNQHLRCKLGAAGRWLSTFARGKIGGAGEHLPSRRGR
jgi:hypothetical protein